MGSVPPLGLLAEVPLHIWVGKTLMLCAAFEEDREAEEWIGVGGQGNKGMEERSGGEEVEE